MIETTYLRLSTRGNAEVVDITNKIQSALSATEISQGIVTVCVIGSTGAVTTCEYEPGLVQDIPDIMDKLIPPGRYHHDQTWHDGNGHSHLRSSFIGPSLTIPIDKGKMILGTWQQVVFIDFDNRPRERTIVLQFMGDAAP